MKKVILKIDGMTCSACSNGLEKYLKKQKGIQNATVNDSIFCNDNKQSYSCFECFEIEKNICKEN